MKISRLKMGSVLVGMAILGLFSCQGADDTDTATGQEEPTVAELRLATEASNHEDQGYELVEQAVTALEADEGFVAESSLFSDCATITLTPNEEGGGTLLLTFDDLCTLNNGAVVSGAILITYSAIAQGSRSIAFVYDELWYNEVLINGEGTLVRTLENEDGNPQSLVASTITVYFSVEEVTATRTARRTREWVEGFGSGTWTDNEYSISGSWETDFDTGFSRSGETVTSLRRKATCPHFVSGILELAQNNVEGTLDYGEGDCDNLAVITINGTEYSIQL